MGRPKCGVTWCLHVVSTYFSASFGQSGPGDLADLFALAAPTLHRLHLSPSFLFSPTSLSRRRALRRPGASRHGRWVASRIRGSQTKRSSLAGKGLGIFVTGRGLEVLPAPPAYGRRLASVGSRLRCSVVLGRRSSNADAIRFLLN
jgi:hypothetical protein